MKSKTALGQAITAVILIGALLVATTGPGSAQRSTPTPTVRRSTSTPTRVAQRTTPTRVVQRSTPTPTPVPCRSTTTLSYGKSIGGQITSTVPQVCYQFQAKRGDRVTITMKKTKGSTTFDPTLELRGPRSFRAIDDTAKADAKISTVLSTDGVYTIVASSRQGQGIGNYTLTLTKQ